MEITPEVREQVIQAVLEQLLQLQAADKPKLLQTGNTDIFSVPLQQDWTVFRNSDRTERDYDCFEAAIAAELSLDEMFRIANGMDHPLIQMRLRGKKAYIRKEGLPYCRFADGMPGALGRKYREYLHMAESYGIAVLPEREIVAELCGSQNVPAEKCILTASKVTELLEKGRTSIVLAKGSIITPLGWDAAKQKGLVIKQEQ